MIALIAESKTMCEDSQIISAKEFLENKPIGIGLATDIMRRIALVSVEEITSKIKISYKMAVRILNMAYEFPNSMVGMEAINAYTGVVFKSFNYNTLSETDKFVADENIRIISSLYGWVKPKNIIKPYRLEFNAKVAPDDRTLANFWKKEVTIMLAKEIKEKNITDILDLMPGDASKCVDKKLIKRFAKIWKVDFKELKDGNRYTTPNSGKLKMLRGELLREIVTRKISTPQELLTLSTDTFLPLGSPDYSDHIAFCV